MSKWVNNIQITPNFNLQEFASPDTGEVKIWIPLVMLLQEMRDSLREPLYIISGYRTPEYNRKLKHAVTNSAHLYGLAADVRAKSGRLEYIASYAEVLGIPRIKLYPACHEFGRGWVHLGFNSYDDKRGAMICRTADAGR